MERWEPEYISTHWQEIDESALKYMVERASIKNAELLSESEVITQRTIKILYAFAVMIVALVASSYKASPAAWHFAVLIALLIVQVYILCRLLFGAKLWLQGTEPKNMLRDILIIDDKNNQLKSLYYDDVVRLQRSINRNRQTVKDRQQHYMASIIVTALFFVFGAILILNNVKEFIHP